MEFSAEASVLKESLNIVTRALAPRPPKQILEGVMISAAADGEITLTCSDGSMSIEADLTGVVDQEGSTVAPGRLFTEMMHKLPGGNVYFSLKDSKAAIRCMSYRSNLSCMSPVEYPEMPVIYGNISITVPQRRLKEMISRVVFSIATDENRMLLTGCLMEITPTELRLVALDGFRMALQKNAGEYTLPEGTDMARLVIPGRVMNELAKVLPDSDDPCELVFDSSRMQVRFGNIRMSSVLLSGEYIDYHRILPTTFVSTATVKRAELNNAIDRASLMAREGKNNLVRLNFENDVLTVSSNAEMGDVREEIEISMNGKPMNIAFNAKYVVDAIRAIPDDTIVMNFNSNVSPCVITSVEEGAYLYLILPVRVFQ